MSILDKLPSAPYGYGWSVFISVAPTPGEPPLRVMLRLKNGAAIPEPRISAIIEVSEADEEDVVRAANRALEEFQYRYRKSMEARRARYRLENAYAHLLTE